MNCKPGDLAYIVYDKHNPQDIGKIVQVIDIAPRWCDPDELEWECKSRDPLGCFDDSGVLPEIGTTVDIPDSWLRPISGVLVENEKYDEVKV